MYTQVDSQKIYQLPEMYGSVASVTLDGEKDQKYMNGLYKDPLHLKICLVLE